MAPVHRYNTRHRPRDPDTDTESVPTSPSSRRDGSSRSHRDAGETSGPVLMDVDGPGDLARAASPTDSAFDLEDVDCRIGEL
jgi:hypothetical protein